MVKWLWVFPPKPPAKSTSGNNGKEKESKVQERFKGSKSFYEKFERKEEEEMIPAISKLFEPKAHEASHHESGSDELDHVDLKNSDTAPHCPVGSIIAWHQNHTETPALPAGWVRLTWGTSPLSATGVLTYSGSPYNTKILPNLNGANNGTRRFLRGNSSSGTLAGCFCHLHKNQFQSGTVCDALPPPVGYTVTSPTTVCAVSFAHCHQIIGCTNIMDCPPPFMDVVWIMRVI